MSVVEVCCTSERPVTNVAASMTSSSSETETKTEAERAAWPMTCTCGEEWPRETWPELPPIGRYLAGRDGWIELRSCVCGATLAVPASLLEPDTVIETGD